MKAPSRHDPASRGYHHGDLRRHLIDVAERLLVERGVEGFTLRECARQAQVSPSAPAHHFGSVTGLFTAIATMAYEGLTLAQEEALVSAGDDPHERLKAIGRAYINYAVKNAGRYRVAFGDLPVDKTDPQLQLAGAQAIGVLRHVLLSVTGQPSRFAGDPAFAAAVALAWSTVHGYARLLIDGKIQSIDKQLDQHDFIGDIADRTLALLVRAFPRTIAPANGPAAKSVRRTRKNRHQGGSPA